MRIEWPTLLLMILCYGLWLAAGIFAYPLYPFPTLLLMAILTAWHSSLSHEALHGHPTSNPYLNEALMWLPLMLFFPYRRYKATHIAHHKDYTLTDPFDDPESYYQTADQFGKLPSLIKLLFKFNNTMAGRMTIGPVLSSIGFLKKEIQLLIAKDREVLRGWLIHIPAAALVIWLCSILGISFAEYLMFVVWPSLSMILLRSYAEHQWHEDPNGRTIIVENSPLSILYLNNNLHYVHHQNPNVPWYELPRLFAQDSANWRRLNKGYCYSGYLALWKQWAFKAKEKVVHPKYQPE